MDAGNRTVTGDKRSTRGLIAGFAVALVALAAPASSLATFPPGENGVIAHRSSPGGDQRDLYGIWTVHPDGSNARNLTPGEMGSDPAYFPDGQRLVFVRNGGLHVMDADGGPATSLTPSMSGFEDYPAVAPNGQVIAFTNYIDPSPGVAQRGDLYLMVLGSPPVLMSSTPDEFQNAADFSPDGGTLVFQRTDNHSQDGLTDGINALDLNSGVETRLTTDPRDRDPAFSPDGSQIIFSRPLASGRAAIWTMNPDGSGERPLLDSGGQFSSVRNVSFSPDGSFLVFDAHQPGDVDLFVANADGSDAHNIVPESTVNDGAPAWQPLPEGSGGDGDGGVLGEVSGGRCAGQKTSISGTDRRDLLRGTRGNDVIATGRGRDVVFARGGRDIVCGDGGRDTLLGGGGRDVLLGGRGKDTLWGGPRRDLLLGGPGLDRLIGGGGRDLYGLGPDIRFP